MNAARSPARAASGSRATALAVRAATGLAAVLALGAPCASSETLSDPTRPVIDAVPAVEAEPSAAPVAWRLSMVRVSDSGRSAVLNGTLVREGDVVSGATVARITRGAVVVDEGGRETVVALAGEPLKRPAPPDAQTRTTR